MRLGDRTAPASEEGRCKGLLQPPPAHLVLAEDLRLRLDQEIPPPRLLMDAGAANNPKPAWDSLLGQHKALLLDLKRLGWHYVLTIAGIGSASDASEGQCSPLIQL